MIVMHRIVATDMGDRLEPSKREVYHLAETECYYVCKDQNLEYVYEDVAKAINPNNIVTIEGCPACIIRETLALLKPKTYMAITPSGNFIEFYIYGNVIYEVVSEEGEKPLISITSYRIDKISERIEELRMQALITVEDAENLLKWAERKET